MHFDSPIERCPVCDAVVLLDQTRAECAKEHDCRQGERCPLARWFTGHRFVERGDADGESDGPGRD